MLLDFEFNVKSLKMLSVVASSLALSFNEFFVLLVSNILIDSFFSLWIFGIFGFSNNEGFFSVGSSTFLDALQYYFYINYYNLKNNNI